MGAGIAQVALEAGWEGVLADALPEAVGRGQARIRDGLRRRAAEPGPPADANAWVEERLARLRPAHSTHDAVDGAHLVIEAAVEDLGVKQALFAELDRLAAPDAILATNTSALSVSR